MHRDKIRVCVSHLGQVVPGCRGAGPAAACTPQPGHAHQPRTYHAPAGSAGRDKTANYITWQQAQQPEVQPQRTVAQGFTKGTSGPTTQMRRLGTTVHES